MIIPSPPTLCDRSCIATPVATACAVDDRPTPRRHPGSGAATFWRHRAYWRCCRLCRHAEPVAGIDRTHTGLLPRRRSRPTPRQAAAHGKPASTTSVTRTAHTTTPTRSSQSRQLAKRTHGRDRCELDAVGIPHHLPQLTLNQPAPGPITSRINEHSRSHRASTCQRLVSPAARPDTCRRALPRQSLGLHPPRPPHLPPVPASVCRNHRLNAAVSPDARAHSDGHRLDGLVGNPRGILLHLCAPS